jgi:hypothetical protein
MRTASGLIGLALLLGLAGCQGSDQASTVEDTTRAPHVTTSTVTATTPDEPPLSPEDKVVGWIRACDVRMILLTHENVVWVKFRGGGLVRLRLDEDGEARVSEAAFAQECEKRITVGIE